MSEVMQEIPLDEIMPGEFQPRKHFDEEKLRELSESIKEKGVLQPIYLRSHPRCAGKYEIICGERRWRASRMAGKETIRAIVGNVDDATALEMAIVENAQRQDLSVVEQAQACHLLKERFGYTAERIAEKLAISKKLVYRRLALMTIPDYALAALDRGDLSVGAAMAIATVRHEALRLECAKKVVEGHWKGGPPMNESQAWSLVEREYMTALKGAPFPTMDAELLPEAGSCADCPHRSGNAEETLLFEVEGRDDDICLNTACFARKVSLFAERQLQKARERGKQVLSPEEAKGIFVYGNVNYDSGYIDIDQGSVYDPEKGKTRTYRQLIGKKLDTVVAIDDRGVVRHLAKRADASALLKSEKNISIDLGGLGRGRSGGKDAEERFKDRVRKLVKERLVSDAAAIVKVTSGWKLQPRHDKLLRLLAKYALEEAPAEAVKKVCKIHGWEKASHTYVRASDVIWKQISGMPFAELLGRVFEVVVAGKMMFWSGQYSGEGLAEFLSGLGLDLKTIEKEEAAALKTSKQAKLKVQEERIKKKALRARAKASSKGTGARTVSGSRQRRSRSAH